MLVFTIVGIIKNAVMMPMISKNNWSGVLAFAIVGLIIVIGECVDLAFVFKIPSTLQFKIIKIAIIVQEFINSILMIRLWNLRNDDPPQTLKNYGIASAAILLCFHVVMISIPIYLTIVTGPAASRSFAHHVDVPRDHPDYKYTVIE